MWTNIKIYSNDIYINSIKYYIYFHNILNHIVIQWLKTVNIIWCIIKIVQYYYIYKLILSYLNWNSNSSKYMFFCRTIMHLNIHLMHKRVKIFNFAFLITLKLTVHMHVHYGNIWRHTRRRKYQNSFTLLFYYINVEWISYHIHIEKSAHSSTLIENNYLMSY